MGSGRDSALLCTCPLPACLLWWWLSWQTCFQCTLLGCAPPSATCCAPLDLVGRSFGGFQPSTPVAVLGNSTGLPLRCAPELHAFCSELVSVLVGAELLA